MEYNSIYGAIKIDGDYQKSVDFLKSLGKDEHYPFFNSNMFSYGDYERPYYYEDIMFGFAATYKGFGLEVSEWNRLILKIENILQNIDFKTAQFHINSLIGDYTLFWGNNKMWLEKYDDFKNEDYLLTKIPLGYFGFGSRSIEIGTLNEPLKIYEDLRNDKSLNFKYPIEFDFEAKKIVNEFTQKVSQLSIGSVVNMYDFISFPKDLLEKVFEVLYSLELSKQLRIVDFYGLKINIELLSQNIIILNL